MQRLVGPYHVRIVLKSGSGGPFARKDLRPWLGVTLNDDRALMQRTRKLPAGSAHVWNQVFALQGANALTDQVNILLFVNEGDTSPFAVASCKVRGLPRGVAKRACIDFCSGADRMAWIDIMYEVVPSVADAAAPAPGNPAVPASGYQLCADLIGIKGAAASHLVVRILEQSQVHFTPDLGTRVDARFNERVVFAGSKVEGDVLRVDVKDGEKSVAVLDLAVRDFGLGRARDVSVRFGSAVFVGTFLVLPPAAEPFVPLDWSVPILSADVTFVDGQFPDGADGRIGALVESADGSRRQFWQSVPGGCDPRALWNETQSFYAAAAEDVLLIKVFDCSARVEQAHRGWVRLPFAELCCAEPRELRLDVGGGWIRIIVVRSEWVVPREVVSIPAPEEVGQSCDFVWSDSDMEFSLSTTLTDEDCPGLSSLGADEEAAHSHALLDEGTVALQESLSGVVFAAVGLPADAEACATWVVARKVKKGRPLGRSVASPEHATLEAPVFDFEYEIAGVDAKSEVELALWRRHSVWGEVVVGSCSVNVGDLEVGVAKTLSLPLTHGGRQLGALNFSATRAISAR